MADDVSVLVNGGDGVNIIKPAVGGSKAVGLSVGF